MNCPKCGTSDFYLGIFTQACINVRCVDYKPVANGETPTTPTDFRYWGHIDKDVDRFFLRWKVDSPIGPLAGGKYKLCVWAFVEWDSLQEWENNSTDFFSVEFRNNDEEIIREIHADLGFGIRMNLKTYKNFVKHLKQMLGEPL